MIFRRALLRELTSTSLTVLGVLLGVDVVTLIVRYLGQSAYAGLPGDVVIPYIGFSLLDNLPPILVLTLFMGAVLTLTRSHSEGEMVIWSTSGLNIGAWLRPVMYFALPMALVVAVVTLWA